MTDRIVLPGTFHEKATTRVTAKITDEAAAALGSAALNTLTLTLYNFADGAIINSRNQQSILNANGGVVDASGNLTLTLAPADMVIVDTGLLLERHVALIEWTYAGGLKTGRQEVELMLRNLTKVV